jgi:hypothetical protein
VNRFEPADHWFLAYWGLHIVEQYSVIEQPQAWLFFQMSLAGQHKLFPFDDSPYPAESI